MGAAGPVSCLAVMHYRWSCTQLFAVCSTSCRTVGSSPPVSQPSRPNQLMGTTPCVAGVELNAAVEPPPSPSPAVGPPPTPSPDPLPPSPDRWQPSPDPWPQSPDFPPLSPDAWASPSLSPYLESPSPSPPDLAPPPPNAARAAYETCRADVPDREWYIVPLGGYVAKRCTPPTVLKIHCAFLGELWRCMGR